MRDGLQSLGHDAVVCGDHQNSDIGYLCPAGTHGCKGLMSRGIQKSDLLAINFNLVGADVLGDAARFPFHDIRLADSIEDARLAVVDMSHDSHYGRAGFQTAGLLAQLLLFLDLGDNTGFSGFLSLWMGIESHAHSNLGRHFVIYDLVNICHQPLAHQLLDDIYRRGFQRFGKCANAYIMR